MIQADSEVLRIEKRIKGLNRVTAAINDLSIYGIFYGNYPELVKVLEHAKDHVKAEIRATKKRIIENSTIAVEEVYTDPLKSEAQKQADELNDMYMKKGI